MASYRLGFSDANYAARIYSTHKDCFIFDFTPCASFSICSTFLRSSIDIAFCPEGVGTREKTLTHFTFPESGFPRCSRLYCLGRPKSSAAIPIEIAALAIHVAVVAPLFEAFTARASVVVAVVVATKLVAILRDPGLIVTNILPLPHIAVHATVAIESKRRRHSHSN